MTFGVGVCSVTYYNYRYNWVCITQSFHDCGIGTTYIMALVAFSVGIGNLVAGFRITQSVGILSLTGCGTGMIRDR